jgi:hypothetical protein
LGVRALENAPREGGCIGAPIKREELEVYSIAQNAINWKGREFETVIAIIAG